MKSKMIVIILLILAGIILSIGARFAYSKYLSSRGRGQQIPAVVVDTVKEKDVIQRNAMHIECVTDNEGRSGFLLYYLANDFIDSIYLDGKEVKNITIIPNDYSEQ